MAKKAVNGWHHPQEPLCPAQSRGDVVYKLNNFFTRRLTALRATRTKPDLTFRRAQRMNRSLRRASARW